MSLPFISVRRYTKVFLHHIFEDEVFGLSAQLAYYFLLSLFPFLIFALSLLGYLGIHSDHVLDLVRRFIPSESFRLIEGNLRSVLNVKHGELLSLGILATIWTASNAMNALFRALNRAYHVEENRHFLLARGLAILMSMAMVVVIIITLALPVFGRFFGEFALSRIGISESQFVPFWTIFRWLISFLAIVLVLTSLYYVAPNRRLHMRDVIFGAVIAAVGWEVVSLGFSYFVSHFGNYNATYGSLTGVVVLMVWFYLTALIIIAGGIINATLHFFKK